MDKMEKARFLMTDEVNEAVGDDLLAFNFDLVEAEVLAYCNRYDFPTGLMLVVIKMVADYTKANFYLEKYKDGEEERLKEARSAVTSVKRGDTTISYGASQAGQSFVPDGSAVSVSDFVDDYRGQLRKYRKLVAL